MRYQGLFQALLLSPCPLTTLNLENGTSTFKPETEIQSLGYAYSFKRESRHLYADQLCLLRYGVYPPPSLLLGPRRYVNVSM